METVKGTVNIRWTGARMMLGVDSRGAAIPIGFNRDEDPVWSAVKPSDLLLLAAASCSAYDVVEILDKQREPLEALDIQLFNEHLGAFYQGAEYSNFMEEIKNDLLESVTLALQAGINKENIILDPGIGFGKDDAGNLALLTSLPSLGAIGHPVLIGPSNKSFIGRLTGAPVEARLPGTLAALIPAIRP